MAALLIYVSAIFIVKGYYDFPTMMQVYSLVLFSVTFASQFMDFSKWLSSLTEQVRRIYTALTSDVVQFPRLQRPRWPRQISIDFVN